MRIWTRLRILCWQNELDTCSFGILIRNGNSLIKHSGIHKKILTCTINVFMKEAVQKKLKTIFICRNPKDVVVSFYNHTKGLQVYEYDGKFENYLQMSMRGDVDYGSYPEYLLEWQDFFRSHPDVPSHVIFYEDLKKNCVEELKRLRGFLELDITNDLLQEISDNCNINKMRGRKPEVINEEAKEVLKKIIKGDYSFMRKGQIGDWKNWFTVAQSEMFDAWWEKESKGLEMFKFQFN